jgi:5-methylcytosine-specific restriction endonuclease McrA/predicted nucleic acid-binding Zn ribbon protein
MWRSGYANADCCGSSLPRRPHLVRTAKSGRSVDLSANSRQGVRGSRERAAVAAVRPHRPQSFINLSYVGYHRDPSQLPARTQGSGVTGMLLARLCSNCGRVLPAETRGRCRACKRPPRSGSSRPELDRFAWQKLRRAARLRDGNRCVRCGATERLSVHHAVEGSNLLEDLLTLCSRCHAREHRSKEDSANKPFFRGDERSRMALPSLHFSSTRTHSCHVCSTPLEYKGTGPRPQFCSKRCKKRAERARNRLRILSTRHRANAF